MRTKRKIAIFTGNRAEYGLQFPIIKAISKHPGLAYYLLVSGAHLDEKFGYTKREIEKDGFKVYAEVKANTTADDLLSTTQAIGSIVMNLSKVLCRIKPDLLIVYADRFEGLAACVAGSQTGIPVAHIEGGDVTSGGAMDDYVRHAMTKLSHLHFTTNEEAKNRILRLGEEKWRVFNVGFPAIDLIRDGDFASHSEICERLGFPLDLARPVILFTQHSVTTELDQVDRQILPSLSALEWFSKKGVQVIATYPNNDAGGRRIIKILDQFGRKNPAIKICPHLGRYYYHGLLNVCGRLGRGVCAGNSSSGIKETPPFGSPFVNIGARQRGRLRAANVLDAGYSRAQVLKAVNKALYDDKFRAVCRKCENPYGKGRAGKTIAAVLAKIHLDKKLIQKQITY